MRAALLLLAFLSACRSGDETTCDDRKDNDVDGLVDCEDPDCADKAACRDDSGIDTAGETGRDTSCPPLTWHADADGDGFGDPADSTTACDAPTGFVDDATDCDDADATLTPADGDGDGFSTCERDCDDGNAADWPGAVAERAGIAMTCIGHGTFTMGSPESETWHDHDEDQHDVRLTGNVEIGVYEVTQAEFDDLMGYNGSFHEDCPTCPIEEVTWHEAAAFANAVSTRLGLAPCYTCTGIEDAILCQEDARWSTPYDCPGYRLPTEAEWEFVARAGETYAYAGSNGVDSVAWHEGNAEASQPVGTRLPNAWGLYDMSGNVWEWTADGYREDITDLTLDPWASDGAGRVARGGAWSIAGKNARVAYRSYFDMGDRNYALGIRLSR